ncbi:RHS repeat-associated core domain-containing protein [Burkholderia sp. AU45251]|uniref:RHS repeat-associated core domain-containing protein n=1 Tax=Burkholderia sp. AU45251 TaxID=3059204 RepID=UPI00264B599E|nr:RHS repeat-associated core domain-containing protein [Burkholderia sp. AU45251]MDN7513934.1 RHS repeat-associated core domain-containing protein [Burkholderia sp. AU45251]
MALLAVKHLDPVVGVDVHSVLVTPGTPPVFLPHPHVGFMLDKREYIQAAKAVVGCIATMIAQEKVNEYIADHPDDVAKLEHLADEANHLADETNQQINQSINDLSGSMGGGKSPDFMANPIVAGGARFAEDVNQLKNRIDTDRALSSQYVDRLKSRISDDLGSNVGAGGGSGRPIFVNGMMRATAGTHAYHVPGLHFPLGESFAPPPEKVEPSNDGESFMGSKTVLANNDPMSYMALEALSCWSIGMEPPPHNSAHTNRTYPSMPSSVMLPIPAGRPVLVGGPPIMNMAAAAKGLFKSFQGSKWAKTLADKLHLKPGFLRCNVLQAEPVDSITGEVIVQQHDFTVMGRLPLEWDRSYASHDKRKGAIGVGWQTPADIRLELVPHNNVVGVVSFFPDHATAFDVMPRKIGWEARQYDWQNGYALYRRVNLLILRTHAGVEYEFSLPSNWENEINKGIDGAALTLPVRRISDLHKNAWAFERNAGQGLERIIEFKGEDATGRAIIVETHLSSRNERQTNFITELVLTDSVGGAHSLVGYECDQNGNLMVALDAMAQPHEFEYDTGHRMIRHTSARGVSFYYSYLQSDAESWKVDRAWGDGGLFDYRFAYDAKHHEIRIIDSQGDITTLQTNERGFPVSLINPLGGVTHYRYDEQGRTCAEVDPGGFTTTWEYDAYGNIIKRTLADGSLTKTEYDNNCRPTCVTAPGNRQWHYIWDDCGKLLEQTLPTNARMHYEYDSHGQLAVHTGPRGAITRFSYDSNGNLKEIINAAGASTRYTCDARANVIKIVNALGQVSRYDYDRNDNLIRAIEPGERETSCSYDPEGNLVRYRDPKGQVTQFEYSALGQVTKRTTPDGGVVSYRYDTEDQLVSIINECGEIYRLNRDELGRIVEEIDYWGQTRRYEYGVRGELTRSIDPLGQAIDYKVDRLGRIVQKRVPDPRRLDGIRTETFSYDCRGNLVAAEHPDSQVVLMYDAANRLVEERQGDTFTIDRDYDAAGNCIGRRTRFESENDIVVHRIRYEYDILDAVTSIQIDDAVPIIFERDALGRTQTEQLTDAMRRELSYTSEGFLAKQELFSGTGSLFSSEYSYSANDEIIGKSDSRLGFESYQYDPVGRLTGHLNPIRKLLSLSYDPTGNLLTTRIPSSPSRNDTWTRDGEYDDCHYAFDRIGNLIHKRDREQDLILRWDGDGLLIETLAVRRGSNSDGLCIDKTLHLRTCYEYDAFHRRTKKTTHVQHASDGMETASLQSQTTSFFWDTDVLASEIKYPEKGGHGVAQEWIYYPDSFVPLAGIQWPHKIEAPVSMAGHERITEYETGDARRGGGQARYGDGEDQNSTFPASSQTTVHYFHVDPNGAPTRITDSEGGIIWEIEHVAWGGIGNIERKFESNHPLRLQGQYYDEETGLHYNRYRYFDSKSAAFISQDPIGLDGGLNLYQFAPNPITWVDPLGLACGPAVRQNSRGQWIDARGRFAVTPIISLLPKLKGKTVKGVEGILRRAGFTRTNPSNPKNQRWKHPDGSEVQVHAYGNTNTSQYKASNNAHAHKSLGKHGNVPGPNSTTPPTVELADDGRTAVHQLSAAAHIGIKNPSDFPAVSGRNHGD